MSTLKELLATLFAGEIIDEDTNGKLTEAYEFDVADYTEQLSGAETVSGEANTAIAELMAERDGILAEIQALKAMNFDALVNGSAAPGDSVETDNDDDPLTDPEISLDELIESATKEKE